MEEKIFANALNHVPEFGPKTLGRVRAHFGSFKKAWQSQISRYSEIPQIEKKSFASLEKIKKELNSDLKTLGRVRAHFGSFKKAWQSQISRYSEIPQIEKKSFASLEKIKKELNPESEFSKLEKEWVHVLLRDELPLTLRETPAPPEVLYVKGALPEENLNYL